MQQKRQFESIPLCIEWIDVIFLILANLFSIFCKIYATWQISLNSHPDLIYWIDNLLTLPVTIQLTCQFSGFIFMTRGSFNFLLLANEIPAGFNTLHKLHILCKCILLVRKATNVDSKCYWKWTKSEKVTLTNNAFRTDASKIERAACGWIHMARAKKLVSFKTT